MHRLHCMAPP
ncbi:hypothetical protein LINPERHAP1_LOCUS22411 [Linum perenne]